MTSSKTNEIGLLLLNTEMTHHHGVWRIKQQQQADSDDDNDNDGMLTMVVDENTVMNDIIKTNIDDNNNNIHNDNDHNSPCDTYSSKTKNKNRFIIYYTIHGY